jgi:UDP-N-acetylmuramoyl-L-alanyl-D-glutamate--2,6-diaminopimelate ligase
MYRIKKLFPQSIKNIYHLSQAILANIWYGFPASRRRVVVSTSRGGPSRKMKVIGVTGTDGKTTTVQMVARILEEAGKKVAMASTINFRINGKEEKNLSHYTTESAFAVQRFIRKAFAEGCEYLVLETSSHSLDQYRVWGINYHTAVITNVTREHLDYHKTMEKYRGAKKKLFENAQTAIVNLDMENPQEFLQFSNSKKITYSTKNKTADIFAEDIELGIDYSSFKVQETGFKLKIPGLFNVENSLAAVCVGLAEGINMEMIKNALEKIQGVPGRMESVPNEKSLNILVDFALTPEALEKIYSFLAGTKKENSKIIAVFGSCGERDRGKRPIMGEVVSKYADNIIVTNDEPYREDPKQIISEIVSGISNKKENEDLLIIPDRRDAINKALQIGKPGDIVVVTGMGAEESMVVGKEKILWNDRQVIEEELLKI